MGCKKGGLFLPDQRCLGGAMVLNSTYSHMLHSTTPKEASSTAAATAAELPSAAQLSLHRSRKLAQTDATTHNHELNLHSLARRISSIHHKPGSLSAACCSQQQPEYQLAGTAATEPRGWKASRAITDLCTWLPGPGAAQLASQTRRPSSAPTGTSGRYRSSSSSSSSSGSGSSSSSSRQPQTDWQLFKRRAAPVPQPAVQPVQLPQSRFYAPGPSLLPSVQARLYKAAIMQDILQRAVYRAADIRALCQQYVAASPLEHRELLRGVAAEVLRELDVPQ